MAEFLVELYRSRSDGAAVQRDAEQARLAAEQLAGEGTSVRYVRSLFVPDDETCFLLYEAVSADAVREAATRAALPFDRISETVGESRSHSPRGGIMRTFRRLNRAARLLVAFAVGGTLFGIATAVQAGIPDGKGVIHGCYLKTSAGQQPAGSLRVIDTGLGKVCNANETGLSWSQTGPTGARGPTGTRGPTGPGGASGPRGLTGAKGATGLSGQQGSRGPTGPQGQAGASGPGAMLTGTTGANTFNEGDYVGSGFVTNDFTTAAQILSVSGTITELAVHLRVAPGSSGTWVLHVLVNGVDEDGCGPTGSNKTCTLAMSVPVSAGDTVAVVAEIDGGSPPATRASWAITIS